MKNALYIFYKNISQVNMTEGRIVLIFLSLLIFIMPLAAGWSQDGVLLHTIEHGTINGSIYIGGGHGREFTTSYCQNFIVPNGTVKWARLYVSAKEATWINVSLNGHQLDNYTDLTNHPKVYANYRTNLGMYWAHFDNAAEWIVNGTNTATADMGTKVGFNTKSWGMALVVVYEGGDNPELIEYWISEGNPLLHSDHSPFSAYRNITDISFINITDLNNITGAELWTIYVWGSVEDENQQHDTLWFNSDLIAEDPSDGAGTDDQGNNWRGACFDLDHWNVRQSLGSHNTILFDRGDDYILCPTSAILILKRSSDSGQSWRDKWMGENSEGGSAITTTELQDAIHHWLDEIPVKDHILTTQDLQEIIAIWLSPSSKEKVSSSVLIKARIKPAIALEVTPGNIDFGILSLDQTSRVHNLTLINKGENNCYVTVEVTDTSDDLFNDGVLVDSCAWTEFTSFIATLESDIANMSLKVPEGYISVGPKEGNLIFWAQTE